MVPKSITVIHLPGEGCDRLVPQPKPADRGLEIAQLNSLIKKHSK